MSGRDWAYLLSLLVPLAVYSLTLKGMRLASREASYGVLGSLGLLQSELFFNLGYASLWIGLFAITRRTVVRPVAVVFFHATTLLVVALTTGAHEYMEVTGSPLELNRVVFTLSEIGDLGTIIASEVPPGLFAVLVLALLYVVAAPPLVSRLAGRVYHLSSHLGAPRVSRLGSLAICVLAVGLVSLSLLPAPAEAGRELSRDAFVNVIANEVERAALEARFEREVPEGDPEGEEPPELAETPATEKRNVALIHLEAVRERSVTPYNEEIHTTPYLDELAEESIFAEWAYTPLPHTSKAITSINCGIDPPLGLEPVETEPGHLPEVCFGDLFGEQGYETVFFQSPTKAFENRPQLVENFGYDEFYSLEDMDPEDFERANYFGYEDDIMLEPSREWLLDNAGEPFFAKYLTVTPHHDYLAPTRYGRLAFAEDDELNRYLNSIRYVDFFVRNLIDQYKELGLYEDTVFVIYSDHGEGFGEHGRYQHDQVIWEEGLRVPLMIHDPQRAGERVGELATLNDLVPTVADLLGYELEGGPYRGNSLLDLPEDRTVFSTCYEDYSCLASIDPDRMKYIYHFGNRPEEVYDLAADPREENDLAPGMNGEELERRRDEVLEWRSGVNAFYEE